MTHELVRKRFKVWPFVSAADAAALDGQGADLNAASDKMFLVAACPIDIYKFGYVTTSGQDPDAGGFQLDLDFCPTAGDFATGRVLVDSILRTDTQVIVAGRAVYKEVIVPQNAVAGDDTLGGDPFGQGSIVNVAPAGPLRLQPGQMAVLEVSNAVGAASTGFVFMEIVELGFEPFNPNVILDT